MKESINLNGKNIYVEHHENHPGQSTLVFLHDSLGSTELWRDFPEKLAQKIGCNWLSYDRLGYGKSDAMPTHERPVNYMEIEAEFLIDLLKKRNIERPIVFGHSDGGTIALWAAAKYPDYFSAIIVEAAHIFVEGITLEGVRSAKESYATTNLKERLERYHGDNTDTLFNAWTETWLREDYRMWSIESILHTIECPVLFIQGEKDEYGTLQQMHKTLDKINPFTDHLIIPDVGHTPHKEKPDDVMQKTVEFLKSALKQ